MENDKHEKNFSIYNVIKSIDKTNHEDTFIVEKIGTLVEEITEEYPETNNDTMTKMVRDIGKFILGEKYYKQVLLESDIIVIKEYIKEILNKDKSIMRVNIKDIAEEKGRLADSLQTWKSSLPYREFAGDLSYSHRVSEPVANILRLKSDCSKWKLERKPLQKSDEAAQKLGISIHELFNRMKEAGATDYFHTDEVSKFYFMRIKRKMQYERETQFSGKEVIEDAQDDEESTPFEMNKELADMFADINVKLDTVMENQKRLMEEWGMKA